MAQVLLRVAWARAADGDVAARPWPWAETWPVARLVVPGRGVDQVVLDGAHGEALAFGPGHVDGTATPGSDGNVVLAGHRDTAFAWVRDLALGDALDLETPTGDVRRYLVRDTRVVDHRDTTVLAVTSTPTLTLVTCYPFDAVRPGGPLRYVVRAEAVSRAASEPPAGGEGHEQAERQQSRV